MQGYKPDFSPIKRREHKTAGRVVQYASGEIKGAAGAEIDFHALLTGMSSHYVVMAVIGNFMRPSGLLPNALVLVNKLIKPKIGDIAGVRVNGDNLIRRFMKRDGKFFLTVDDPREPPYEIREGDNVELIGTVDKVINFILPNALTIENDY